MPVNYPASKAVWSARTGSFFAYRPALTVKTLGFETLNEWLLPTAKLIHFMVQRLWERLGMPAYFTFLPLGHFAASICQTIKLLRG